ncbi:hypothetical protein LguiA_012654 [Lonicera macranthoides]
MINRKNISAFTGGCTESGSNSPNCRGPPNIFPKIHVSFAQNPSNASFSIILNFHQMLPNRSTHSPSTRN